MAETIIMPQGGQDITEGQVVQWLKSEGDEVKKGEVICEVETEKAVFEVWSPADGVLLKIIVPGGQKAKVFSTIGIVGAAGERIELEDEDDAISNMGMLNVDNFVAIINPAETAILAVGSTRKSIMVASDNSFLIRDTMSMTLSADHRAIDGVLGSQFVKKIKFCLENPQILLR